MAIEKEPEAPADIPSWLMTFSDVITLLMTFFILLLTFASSEPESFDRLQVSLFGGGGSKGIVRKKEQAMDFDSVIMRKRSRAGRITQRGTEMPTIHTDPSYTSVNKGIAGLENDEDRELSERHAITIPINLIIDSSKNITPLGKQQFRILAQQLKRLPLDIELRVGTEARTEDALLMATHLFEEEKVLPGKIGVSFDRHSTSSEELTIIMTYMYRPGGQRG